MKLKGIITVLCLTALTMSLVSCSAPKQEAGAAIESIAETEIRTEPETRGPMPTKPDMLTYQEYLKYLRDTLPKEGQLVSAGDAYALGISPQGKVLYAGPASEDDADQKFGTSYQAVEFQNVVQVCAKPEYYAAALLEDGTIAMTEKGKNAADEGQWQAKNWTDMVSFSASDYTTIGVKKDGSIAAAGGSHPHYKTDKEWGKDCPIPEWKNLKQFLLVAEQCLAGIDENGELVYAENDPDTLKWMEEENAVHWRYWYDYYWHADEMPMIWNHLVDIAAGRECFAGVQEDGRVIVGGPYEVYDVGLERNVPLFKPFWLGVVDVEFMDTIMVGLTEKGTIKICNINSAYPIEPEILRAAEWTDLVDISTSRRMIIGVQSDGTVLAAGYPQSVVEEINTWKVSPWEIDRDIPHETS